MSYLKNITRFSGSGNLGGILTIQVARAADVDSIPDPVAGIVFGDIVLKAGKSFYTWQVTDETAEANTRGNPTPEGFSKDNTLPFFIPKDRSDIRDMLEGATEDELIVLFKDGNGKQKLFGLLDHPVQFEYSTNSGAAHADRNGYSCRFYYKGPENIFEYNGTLPTAPAGAAPAIVRVNGTVVASLQPGESIDFDTDFEFDFAIVGT